LIVILGQGQIVVSPDLFVKISTYRRTGDAYSQFQRRQRLNYNFKKIFNRHKYFT